VIPDNLPSYRSRRQVSVPVLHGRGALRRVSHPTSVGEPNSSIARSVVAPDQPGSMPKIRRRLTKLTVVMALTLNQHLIWEISKPCLQRRMSNSVECEQC
jgi:hypothetical protein